MSADDEKPIVLREVCERCSKPKFPTRPGSTASILHRPGFCNCALRDALKKNGDKDGTLGKEGAVNPNETYMESARRDDPLALGMVKEGEAEVASGQSKGAEDPGYKIKLPNPSAPAAGQPGAEGSSGAKADGEKGEASKADVAKSGTKFDPNVQLTDLIAEGYTFFERVGKGTMGYVYQARAEHMDALLAMKIFHRAPFKNKRTLKRLEQEAGAAIGVSHPHLASVYKFGVSAKEYPYIIMDFMAGPSLAEVLQQEGFLDPPRAIDVFIQITEALEFAHGQKLLHRGLKPSNIYLLVSTGGRDFVKVSDFGIAKVLPNPGRETRYMTPMGEEFGNPNYMSPEQCLGNRLDARADIYSLGCIMYECVSGKVPHSSSNNLRVAFKQVSEEARSLVERFTDLDIPKDLDDVILACLKKDPDQRFASAKELKLALEALRDNKKPKLPSSISFSGAQSIAGGQKFFDKLFGLIKKDNSKQQFKDGK